MEDSAFVLKVTSGFWHSPEGMREVVKKATEVEQLFMQREVDWSACFAACVANGKCGGSE